MKPAVEIDIMIQSGAWDDALPDYKDLIARAVEEALSHLGARKPCELSVVLTDDAQIQALNKKWRGKDKPTNVLSFPQDEEFLLGDIVLGLETIMEEARTQNKTLADHTAHLIVHGLLHLLGYDHEEDGEAEEMEGLETEICTRLGIKNPYAEDDKHPRLMA